MKTTFYLRTDNMIQGKNPIYLRISGNSMPSERIHTYIYVDEKNWHSKKQRVFENCQEHIDINLILMNIEAKLTQIQTFYRLAELSLTPKILRAEYEDKLSRVNFVAFFKAAIPEQKMKVGEERLERYETIYHKLKEFQPVIAFKDLDLKWIEKFKAHLRDNLKNQDTTIASNIAIVKKFLGIAKKEGIKLQFELDDLEVGSTKGNRTYLLASELQKCLNFYFSEFINPSYKLILGYFLFSCMNGLRISNVQGLKRTDLMSNDFSIILVKGNHDKNMILNKTARRILEHEPRLFEQKFANQHLNDEIKKIMSVLGINKKVTFHVARHTFATLFLKAGGKIEMLKMLLGHSSIVQTMIYVHIVQAEANEEMFLLDDLFKIKAAV
ncbi:MAG: site-specific integrase [Flavobacteriaceae bacterium]|nr:site-specific integrase [Flavobacteriaceae bacterium]